MYIVHTFHACTEDTAQKMGCFFMVNRAFLGGGYMHEYPEYMWIAPGYNGYTGTSVAGSCKVSSKRCGPINLQLRRKGAEYLGCQILRNLFSSLRAVNLPEIDCSPFWHEE